MASLTEFAGKAVGAARAATAALTGYRGIFRTLKREHGQLSVLLMRVQAERDGASRAHLFPLLRAELLAHDRAEKHELYAALAEQHNTSSLVARSESEQDRIAELLDAIDRLPYGDPGWHDRFHALVRTVQTHIHGEEHQLYPLARDLLSETEMESIDRRYKAERERELRALMGGAPPPIRPVA